MRNLESKLLRYLNDPVLNKYRKDINTFSKGIIFNPVTKSPKENPNFEDFLFHYIQKWKRLYSRIHRSHHELYKHFRSYNRLNLDRNLRSIGDILWASSHQLLDINFSRDICHFTREFIRGTIHLQKIQPREESRINLASELLNEEFENNPITESNQSSRK